MKRKSQAKENNNFNNDSGDDEIYTKRQKTSKKATDYFMKHIDFDADDAFVKSLQAKLQLSREPITLSAFNDSRCLVSWRNGEKRELDLQELNLRSFGVSPKLCSNYEGMMLKCGDPERAFTAASLYQIVGRYMDLCMVSPSNFYLELVCLHVLNHITRTRRLVIQNKQTLEALKEQGVVDDEEIERCRDQGLTRPKVLILCPFRKHAYDYVHNIIKIMFGTADRPFVTNLAKFNSEFTDEENRVHEKRQVAAEYKELMSGNVDDCFRLGIGLAKKCLKLYTPFDESDILLCSPVGLRMTMGGGDNEDGDGEGESSATAQFDCLSSVEIVVVDKVESVSCMGFVLAPKRLICLTELKAHILFMQNWEHLLSVFDALNKKPAKVTADISRIRHWALHDYSHYYRQSLIFSELNFLEMHALAARHCRNYAGDVSVVFNPRSLLPEVTVPNVQGVFRLPNSDPQAQSDVRFKFFVEKVLPKCEPHTLIFVSSYFDFVRLRNYMKRDGESFAQVHEYAKKGKIAKARHMFFNGQRKLLLLTERFYFYYRYRIKGVRSVIFYQLPVNPIFYAELINVSRLHAEKQADENFKVDVRILFSKFDFIRLQNVFGVPAANRLVKAEEECFAIVGE